MSTIKRFEDIEAWQLSRELYKVIFRHTCEGEFVKDYGLKDQIRRSTGSIMDNIAEGFERDGNREFIQFLSYSKGSSGEVKSQLYRALDSNYIDKIAFEELSNETDIIGSKLGTFIKYLKSSGFRGTKYK